MSGNVRTQTAKVTYQWRCLDSDGRFVGLMSTGGGEGSARHFLGRAFATVMLLRLIPSAPRATS
jgi:hypothetical protein